MSKQRCVSCGHEWDYNGIYLVNTTCPDCQKRTPINRTKEEIEEVKELRRLKKELEKEEEEREEGEHGYTNREDEV